MHYINIIKNNFVMYFNSPWYISPHWRQWWGDLWTQVSDPGWWLVHTWWAMIKIIMMSMIIIETNLFLSASSMNINQAATALTPADIKMMEVRLRQQIMCLSDLLFLRALRALLKWWGLYINYEIINDCSHLSMRLRGASSIFVGTSTTGSILFCFLLFLFRICFWPPALFIFLGFNSWLSPTFSRSSSTLLLFFSCSCTAFCCIIIAITAADSVDQSFM